jgi:hypothetical protein
VAVVELDVEGICKGAIRVRFSDFGNGRGHRVEDAAYNNEKPDTIVAQTTANDSERALALQLGSLEVPWVMGLF